MSHLGGAYEGGDPHTHTPDIWGWLLIEYDIKSVVDIGCGYGHNLKWFYEMGCDVKGIEGDPEAIEKNVLRDKVVVHDYTTGPLVMDNHYDLCLCTEFVEHVEQKYEDNWIATAKCASYFLMCHAVPGQGGHHHVNEQTKDYWEERLGREGFTLLDHFGYTCFRKPAPWGRNTLMLFSR